jgi:transposase
VNLVLIQGCRFEEAALSRGDLTEVEWRILRVLLPVERKSGKRGRGRPPEDDRNIINGILSRLRTGAPWRDVPEKYGKWNFLSSRTAADSAHLVSASRQGVVAASGSIEAKDAEIVFRWADGPPWMASPQPERFTGAIFISAGVASEF